MGPPQPARDRSKRPGAIPVDGHREGGVRLRLVDCRVGRGVDDGTRGRGCDGLCQQFGTGQIQFRSAQRHEGAAAPARLLDEATGKLARPAGHQDRLLGHRRLLGGFEQPEALAAVDSRLQGFPPGTVLKVPLHRLLDARLEMPARLPGEFAAHL
jgi:hypothetical protein